MNASEFFNRELTTLQLLYHRPDHPWLLQEFVWQVYDLPPKFPRVHRFLSYWRTDVEAVIHSVTVVAAGICVPISWRTAREVGSC